MAVSASEVQHAQLIKACGKGDLAAVQVLVQAGASIHEGNDAAFRVACSAGSLAVAQWLVAQGGVDIHALQDDAVRRACVRGHLAVVQWLVSLGGVDFCRSSAFFGACYCGHLALVQWLVVQGGVDIHTDDNYAFSMACAVGHLAVGRWLVQQDPEYESWPPTGMACLKTWSETRAAWMRSVVGAFEGRA